MTGRRRRWIVGLVVGIAIVVGGLAAAVSHGLLLRDSAKAVSVEEAVRQFRAGGHGAGRLEGVYLYRTSGGESIDALGGAHHSYPATTSVTAVRSSCGLDLRWASLEGREDTWRLCATKLGIELQGYEETHHFFGQSDRTSYDCTGGVLLAPDQPAGSTRVYRCTSNGAAQVGEARVVGREETTVGGRTVSAAHVRTTARISGRNSGTEIVDWWIDASTGLPTRIVLTSRTSRHILIVGTVHYREDADLRLVSKTPRR